jgi:hypothetical protein
MLRARLIILLAALAATLALPVEGAVAAEFYGPWYPDPNGTATAHRYYRPDIDPFSTSRQREIVSFQCVYPGKNPAGEPITYAGVPLSQVDQEILRDIFQRAYELYTAQIVEDKWNGLPRAEVMRRFLQEEKQELINGSWRPYSTEDGVSGDVGPYKLSDRDKRYQNPSLARLINTRANHPAELTQYVPDGCSLAPIRTDGIKISDLWNDTSGFIVDILLYVPSRLSSFAFDLFGPGAMRVSFWTPHVERGDTIFNVHKSCQYGEVKYKGQGEDGNMQVAEAKQLGTPANARDFCDDSNQPLGFSKKRLTDDRAQLTWYIRMGMFFQWLISGTYFLLLFTGAMVYIFRGDSAQQFNVLQMMPRLLVSAIGTLFAPWAIGALVSVSNWFVEAMFSYNAATGEGSGGRAMGLMADIIRASEFHLPGFGDDLFGRALQIALGFISAWYFMIFLLISAVRQFVMMGVVMLAPVALFCFIIPAWQHHFGRWLRVLMACLAIPPVMALILKIGTSLNPILDTNINPNQKDVLNGLLGMMAMVATLWAMARVGKMASAYARGNRMTGSFTGKLLRAGGQAAAMAGIAGSGGALAPLLRYGGLAAQGLGMAAQATEGIGGGLVPKGRGMLAAGSPIPSFGETGVGRQVEGFLGLNSPGMGAGRGMGMGGSLGLLGASSYMGGQLFGGRNLMQRFAERQTEKMAREGRQRITPIAAMSEIARRDGDYEQWAEMERERFRIENGRDMTKAEEKALLAEENFYEKERQGYTIENGKVRYWTDDNGNPIMLPAYNDVHGSIERRGGVYYRRRPEVPAEVPQDPEFARRSAAQAQQRQAAADAKAAEERRAREAQIQVAQAQTEALNKLAERLGGGSSSAQAKQIEIPPGARSVEPGVKDVNGDDGGAAAPAAAQPRPKPQRPKPGLCGSCGMLSVHDGVCRNQACPSNQVEITGL